jgi:capsular polysaccharide biosynthesis protein
MLLAGLKRRISTALVRTTTAAKAYPRADWTPVLESETTELAGAVAPPFASEASHLEPHRYATPRVMTASLRGALYYSYLNVLTTPFRTILLDTDNTYLEHPSTPMGERFYWRNLYHRPVEEIPGVSFVLRSPANNFYHTLVDNLPRLYALQQPRYATRPISLLVPGRLLPYEEHFLSNLLPANVAIVRIRRDRLYRLEEVIFCSYISRQMSGYLPRAYLEFFLGKTLPRRPRRRRGRIYVTRRQSPVGRRILNETDVMRAVERFGFQSHALEDLSLAAQVELFYDAEAVMGTHGAGLTNLLFADRAGVIELHPRPTAFPHYYFLCGAMGHRYRYLCANEATRHSDLSVDIEALTASLKELLESPNVAASSASA